MVGAQLIRELTAEWRLRITGPTAQGERSTIVPVAGDQGHAVLKVASQPTHVRDQARALTAWNGAGAVHLLAADPGRSALLLEALDPRSLNSPPVTVLDSSEEIGRLARILDRPAPPWLKDRASDRLRTLVESIDAIRTGTQAHALPRRLLERSRSLALDLVTDPDIDTRLVHAALHQEHVLWRPEPGEWVAISPAPVAADPTWVVAPALWHRWEDTAAAYDVRTHLNFRLDVICETAGLDPDRARVVSELRVLTSAVEHVLNGPGAAEVLTRHVTLLKALQPA